MDIKRHDVDKDLLIVRASESINDDQAEPQIERLESDIQGGRYQRIIIDCEHLQFLSSFGLSMIMRLRNAAKQVNVEVKLAGLTPMVQELFRATKMLQHFMTYPDLEQARAAFHLRRM